MQELKNYKHFCIVDTVYTLFLYLIYADLNQIRETFFVFGKYIPNNVAKKFINSYKLKPIIGRYRGYKQLMAKLLDKIVQNYLSVVKIPPINKDADIYCIDNMSFASVIIRNRKYMLIEDSPRIFHNYVISQMKNKDDLYRETYSYKINKFLMGKIVFSPFGNNDQCKAILMTQKDNTDYIQGKKLLLMNIESQWASLTIQHKSFVCDVFGLDINKLRELREKQIILFTQPMYVDIEGFTIQDQVDIYSQIISKYPINEIVIKCHPRDEIDYASYFPQCLVLSQKIPSQLLSLNNISFTKAITINSSAVYDICDDCQVDWYGSGVHDKILKAWGDAEPPKNANICHL